MNRIVEIIPVVSFFVNIFCLACGGEPPVNITSSTTKSAGKSYVLVFKLKDANPSSSNGLMPKRNNKTIKSLFLINKNQPSLFHDSEYLGSISQSLKKTMNYSSDSLENLDRDKNEKIYLYKVIFDSEIEAVEQENIWRQKVNVISWEADEFSELYARSSPDSFDHATHLKLTDQYQFSKNKWWVELANISKVYKELIRDNLKERNFSLKSTSPVIAILDSGVDYLHPGLKNSIWKNPRPGSAGCKNDKNGCDTTISIKGHLGAGPALPLGTNKEGAACPVVASTKDSNIYSACFHGTHVAGIISGESKNGLNGICPMCKVMPIKVVENVQGRGLISDSSLIKALIYIKNINREYGHLVRLVNLSFGKFDKSMAISLLIKDLQKDGVLFLAAAGNDNSSSRVYPAAFSEVLSVTGIAESGRKASYANYGSWVNLAAPGGDLKEELSSGLLSSSPGGGFEISQGTSVACPIVTGVAGLLLFFQPNLTNEDLKRRLINGSNRQLYDKNFARGHNRRYYTFIDSEKKRRALLGKGLLDAEEAFKEQVVSLTSDEENLEKRVKANCGSIAKQNEHSFQSTGLQFIIMLFLWLMPVLVVVRKKREQVYE